MSKFTDAHKQQATFFFFLLVGIVVVLLLSQSVFKRWLTELSGTKAPIVLFEQRLINYE